MAAVRTANILQGGAFDVAADLTHWTQVSGAWEIFTSNVTGTDPFSVGSAKPTDASTGTAELAQVVDLTTAGIADATVDDQICDVFIHGMHAGDSSDSDNQRFVVEALDDLDVVIGTPIDSGVLDTTDNNWTVFTDQAALPIGTRKVRVRLLATKITASFGFNSYFDSVSCHIVTRDKFSRQLVLSQNLAYRNNYDGVGATEPELVQGAQVGTFNGTAGRTASGQFGQAYISNAASDSLTTPDYRAARTDPTSVSAWIWLDALPSAMFGSAPRKIVAKGNGTTSGWFLGVLAGDVLTFRVVDAALSTYEATYTFTAPDVGKWIHVVGTQSASAIKIYIDGVEEDSQLVAGALEHDASDIEVGLNWEGRIDEVMVWGKVLSTSNSEGVNEIVEASKQYAGPDSVDLPFDGAGNPLQYHSHTISLNQWPSLSLSKYLVAGQAGNVSRNPDARTILDQPSPWDLQSTGGATRILCLARDPFNHLWVAGDDDGHIWTSVDGEDWTDQGDQASGNAIRGLHYADGTFVAVGDGGIVRSSTDAVTWTPRTSGLGAVTLYDVTKADDTWVVVGAGGTVSTSDSLTSWTPRIYPHSGDIRGVVWNNLLTGNHLVAVGDAGEVATSSDKGATWGNLATSLPATQLNAVGYYGGMWVAVGNGGLIGYGEGKSAPTSWSIAVSGTVENLNDIHHPLFDGTWLIGGDAGVLLEGGDGTSWVSQDPGFAANDIEAVFGQVGSYPNAAELQGSIALVGVLNQDGIDFATAPNGLEYTDSPFEVLLLPVNPNPVISDSEIDCDTDVLTADVDLGFSDGSYVTYFWEVEMEPGLAFLRIAETGPVALDTDPHTLMLTFTQPEGLDLSDKRMRFIVTPQSMCGAVMWASPWVTLTDCTGGGGGPPPGPGPNDDVFNPIVFNIYLNRGFDALRRYSLERESDIDTTVAEDFFWHCVQVDPDDECGPAPVDIRERKLVLENLPAGRYRYRFSAQFTDKSVYQDFILFVRPDSRQSNV